MQVKCPVILTCLLGVVIVADELTWGYVRKRSCCREKSLQKASYHRVVLVVKVIIICVRRITSGGVIVLIEIRLLQVLSE